MWQTSNKSVVSIRKVKDTSNRSIEAAFNALLRDIGRISRILPAAPPKVLIKPNMVAVSNWRTGITVHPFLVELLIKEIKRQGLEVIVGEGVGLGVNSEEVFKKNGIAKICRRFKVPLIDFKRGKEVTVPIPDGKLLKKATVDEIVPECDFIVSAAKMKTHCECLVSLSMKNMKGLETKDSQRLRYHLMDVNRCLADLNRVFKPDLAIVEGIIALEGLGPLEPGKPKELDLLVGGTDPVAVDAICTKIMRMNPEEVRHIVYAAEAGLGTMDLDNIEVVGESLEAVTPESYEGTPRSIEGISPFEKIKIVNGKPCSNCLASLAAYLNGYIDTTVVDRAVSDVTILIGAKAKSTGSGKEIAIGNCLKRYRGKLPFVPGCPPPSDAYLKIVERGLLEGDFSISTVDDKFNIVDVEERQFRLSEYYRAA